MEIESVDSPVPTELAISVKNVSLRFHSRTKVLNNLSLQVPKGSIYGLLGPSGCGKTSLIRCILGMLPFDSGSLNVFGEQPGSQHPSIPGAGVGYMPQDICLYPDLSIQETLNYFAELYGVPLGRRQKQCNFLMRFLELPPADQIINVLSGGTKRRVSLATALIHKPPLLILDEPTVGVDPLLRRSIWRHLIELSEKNNMTVLITTHYVEEAKDANVVGFMRDGHILNQNNPSSMMDFYNLSSLEQVFLHLCEHDNNSSFDRHVIQKGEESDNESLVQVDSVINKEVSFLQPNSSPKKESSIRRSGNACTQVSAMVRKNFKSLLRNIPLMLFQFLLPTIEVVLFCLCIGRNLHSIPVAIYDGDLSPLSELMLEKMNPVIIRQQLYNSSMLAIEAVRQGRASSAMIINENFALNLYERISNYSDIDDEAIRNSTIHIHPDMSNQLTIMTVQQEVLRSFVSAGQTFLRQLDLSPFLLQLPIKSEDPVYGHANPSFTEYMAPGVISSIAFLAAIPLTAMAFVVERKNGLTERALVAGVTYHRILISHLLPHSLYLLFQILPIMLFVFPCFGIPYHGEFLLILALTYLQSICGMSFGLFVSALAHDENAATMLALGFFYPNLMLSGTVWPIEAMEDYLRYFSYCLPQTWPIQSMRYMIARGWGIMHWEVATGFAITIGWILLFLILAEMITCCRKK